LFEVQNVVSAAAFLPNTVVSEVPKWIETPEVKEEPGLQVPKGNLLFVVDHFTMLILVGRREDSNHIY